MILISLISSSMSSRSSTSSLVFEDEKREVLNVAENKDIAESAAFVTRELRGLSDSGIYETFVEPAEIVAASTQAGVYHDMIFMTMRLRSPYLFDGAAYSQHEVVVMRNIEDGVRTFAIDEFPRMDEDAIEAFWIERVERNRANRERVFEAIEREKRAAA